mgnify:CR=1 FL=1
MEALTWAEILSRMVYQLIPVWIAMIALFSISIFYKRNLGLYGKLFDSKIGMIGFGIVMFWVFVGFFAGAFLFLIQLAVIVKTDWKQGATQQAESTIDIIGSMLLWDYFLAFEIVSVLLLAALIGAAFLSRRNT